jgi:hypothetical protein
MFGSLESGRQARETLLQAGIADERIALSANLTDDAIAAEVPGQAFENQEYASSDQVRASGGWSDTEHARYLVEVCSAACVLSVRVAGAVDAGRVRALLRRAGARRAISRPPD